MMGMLQMILIAGVAGTLLTFVAVWLLSYSRTDDAERATQQTSRKFVAVASAGVFSIAVALNELAGLFGTLGDIVATWPAAVGQFLLGGLAVAGFAGWLELGVVAATIVVAAVIVVTIAIRN